jgi:hypothetical protein
MLDFANLTSELLASKLAASIAIVALAVAMQMVLRRSVLRYMSRADLRLRWMVGLRNVVVLLALVALASIWMDELRAFATAVVAFAVAFVIATKEFILCASTVLSCEPRRTPMRSETASRSTGGAATSSTSRCSRPRCWKSGRARIIT